MKKNYTLKITLAMLFVVLVSLVSFVGVYKGKNLIKGYSLGKDFKDRKVAVFSVKEEVKSENTGDNSANSNEQATNEDTSDDNKTEENNTNSQNDNQKDNYEKAKKIINKDRKSVV